MYTVPVITWLHIWYFDFHINMIMMMESHLCSWFSEILNFYGSHFIVCMSSCSRVINLVSSLLYTHMWPTHVTHTCDPQSWQCGYIFDNPNCSCLKWTWMISLLLIELAISLNLELYTIYSLIWIIVTN